MSGGNKGSLVGFVLGAVFGSTAVLLLTPRTGGQIRDTLVKEARRLCVKASRLGFDPNGWKEIVARETGRNIVSNIERIRAAGL